MAEKKSKVAKGKSTASFALEAKHWLTAAREGAKTHRFVGLLGRMYEYFLTRFASAKGENSRLFYTPSRVVLAGRDARTHKGRIYDPVFGPGGMFVQAVRTNC